MKAELYKQIVRDINEFTGIPRDIARMLIQKYSNIPAETIHGILSIYIINKLRSTSLKLPRIKHMLWERYESAKQNGEPSGIIVRLSGLRKFPPSLVARSIIEYYYQSINQKDTMPNVCQYMKDPTLIDDQELAYEIYLSILYDDRNGPIAQAFAQAIGYEYETKLQNCLTERGIAFVTEDGLRKKGYDKTPDIKLEIPIAVNGCIVNWIESKARFGDSSIHKDCCKNQLSSYWNRFGPGLIIYWFDFVDNIVQPNEKRFIIMNDFPENITYMDSTVSI